jgi:hypothetical protein
MTMIVPPVGSTVLGGLGLEKACGGGLVEFDFMMG